MAASKHTGQGGPTLSIVIVSFNTKDITIRCLESIFDSNVRVPFEIVLIDNASTDGSAHALKDYAKDHPEVRFIENKDNIGFGRANNQGVKLAKGEYVFLLNSDTEVLGQSIDTLYTYYRDHEESQQFVGGKLIEKDGVTPQPSCGPFYSLPVVFGALFLRGDYWGLTRYSPTEPRMVDWVSGACIMTKKEYFEQLGGFSEDIFMYMEEIDLLYRARKKGLRTAFCPDARFIHLGSASSGGKTYPILQVYRGFLYFYRKHHGPLETLLLKNMLKLKAITAVAIGKMKGSAYLTQTYEKAFKLVDMD